MDYFDTDEIRRRRMLDPYADAEADKGIDSYASPALAPDEGELAGEDTPSGPVSATPTPGKSGMGAAQQRYSQVLQQTPERPQVSIGRRILAGIAGAGGGPEAAYGVLDRPYQKTMADWQTRVQAAGMGAGLEEKVMSQDIARQRADAYGRSATARERAATATEAWRRYQEAHMPFAPHSMEEALQLEGAKHPAKPPAGWQPQSLQEYLQAHPPKTSSSYSVEDRIKINDQAARSKARYRVPKDPKQIAPATPVQMNQADMLARNQVARENPRFAKFIKSDGKGGVIERSPDDLKGWFTSQAEQAQNEADYAEYQAALKRRSQSILGPRSVGGVGGSRFKIEVQQ